LDDSPIDARKAGERRSTAHERDAARLEDVLLRRAEAAAQHRRDRHERGDREENRRPKPEEAADAHFAEAFAFALPLTLRRFSRMKLLGQLVRLVVDDLLRRRLHQVASWPDEGAATPLFSASFASRTASITMPAEFGESQTSSFSSTLSGTSPNDEPSIRMYAHLRSVSHGT
jgi:hypothetical protein